MYSAWRDFIIFKTNALFNEDTGFKGLDGQAIIRSVKFEPEKHCRIYGEVVSVPKYLSRIKMHQDPKGSPGYVSLSPFKYKWMDDIEMEVQVGDTIYFHYNEIMRAIKEKSFIHIEGERENRVWYIKVRYDRVFCAVRDGVIIPIQGYTFVEPDFETWNDIMRPVPAMGKNGKPLTNKDGSIMYKPKEQWILTKSAPEHQYLRGFVKHVGTPLRGDKCEIKVGQPILYRRNAQWLQSINGHNYFTILQRDILGRFEEEAA